MADSENSEKLIALFKREIDADVELSTDLDALALESLDFLDLVLQCEIEFNVKIPQESIVRMNTVEDVLTIIGEARGVPVSG
jgi:acyl carrier protein